MSVEDLNVLFADNHLLVVEKPAGMPTVPDESRDLSLLEMGKAWIKQEYSKPGEVFLGVVQRLDRPVSGVICFARTSKAAARLTKAFGEQAAHKTYLAIGVGELDAGLGREGEVRQWLVKDRESNRVTAFASEPTGRDSRGGAKGGAKLAVTRWRWQEQISVAGGARTLLEMEPVTGRSHQLRLAARSLGVTLLGDVKYGRGSEPLEDRSIALHAWRLEFEHPVKREKVEFEVLPPERDWWRGWS